MNGDILERLDCDAQALSELFQFRFHGTPVGIRVAIEKNRLSAGLDGEFFQFGQCVTLAKDQAGTNSLKIRIQRAQASTKEMLAVRTSPAMAFFPIAQNINWNNLRTRRSSSVKSGVVREAKVSAEPMDDSFQNTRILVRMEYHTEPPMAKSASPVRSDEFAR